jgi:hypothetical protein
MSRQRSLMPIIYALFVMQIVTGAYYASALIDRHRSLQAVERRLDIVQARLTASDAASTSRPEPAISGHRQALAASASNRRDLDRLKHETDALFRDQVRLRPLVGLQLAIAMLALAAALVERRRRRDPGSDLADAGHPASARAS